MSADEEKAIEVLDSVKVSLMNFNEITEENKNVIISIDIVLNLIKKQQAEIKRLKENKNVS